MTDTRQALAALLPCPFCGNSKGLAVANENPQDLSGGYFIACPSCDASTGLRFACGEDPIPLLIEQWNRRAALSAQPVAGAVAVDETGWLIEHSGEILPGAEQRAQVSWLRVQMKFNGYGAREFGFTHDANEALRFARKEDAEAVLAMHLGASPPDWYSKPFSVTEHMWPDALQPQAAPATEPSAQPVAGAVAEPDCWAILTPNGSKLVSHDEAKGRKDAYPLYATPQLQAAPAPEPSDEAECEHATIRYMLDATKAEPSAQAVAHPSHQTVREWMPVSEALRLSDLWTAGDLDNCGQWRAAIKVLADEVRALAASPQPAEPSAQGEPVAWRPGEPIYDDAYVRGVAVGFAEDDSRRTTLLRIADRIEARASAPSTPPPAVVEAVPQTWPIERAADMLTAYAELVKATGRYAEEHYIPEIENVAAELRGIAPKAAQPVAGAVALWQYRWTNPAGYEDEPAEALEWKELVPRPYTNQTLEDRIAELRGYEHNGKAIYEVRPLYAAPQPQAAPAPEPSRLQKMREAGFTARDTRLTCDECGAKFTRQFAPLHECAAPEPSAQAVMTELEQRLIEIAKALPPMTTLGWNDGGMCEPDEAIKGYTKKQVLEILAQHLSASPQPEPSAQGEPAATVTDEMVTAYLTANDAYWRRIDGEPTVIGKWRGHGTPSEATRVSLMAALASAPSTPPHAVVEAVPLAERWVVVCESVLDVGFGGDVREGGRPELGYALLANATTFDSEDKAKAAIRNAKLPIGWVYMPLSRLLPDLLGIAPKAAQEKT